eukprot:11259870-Ditylum_brightwellii.AAC.1
MWTGPKARLARAMQQRRRRGVELNRLVYPTEGIVVDETITPFRLWGGANGQQGKMMEMAYLRPRHDHNVSSHDLVCDFLPDEGCIFGGRQVTAILFGCEESGWGGRIY